MCRLRAGLDHGRSSLQTRGAVPSCLVPPQVRHGLVGEQQLREEKRSSVSLSVTSHISLLQGRVPAGGHPRAPLCPRGVGLQGPQG